MARTRDRWQIYVGIHEHKIDVHLNLWAEDLKPCRGGTFANRFIRKEVATYTDHEVRRLAEALAERKDHQSIPVLMDLIQDRCDSCSIPMKINLLWLSKAYCEFHISRC